MSHDRDIRVNLGCGHIQPAGWVNVDGSNRAWLAHRLSWLDTLLVRLKLLEPTPFGRHTTICNLFKPLPWGDASVAAIYAGELFEHFTPQDLRRLLLECVRVLKPGGVLRLCVPDCQHFFRKYVAECDRVRALPREQWDDASIRRLMGVFFADVCVRRKFLGSMGHFHKWGYDEVSMVLELERVGLKDVQRREFGQSAIPDITQVETRVSEFLIVEGRKP